MSKRRSTTSASPAAPASEPVPAGGSITPRERAVAGAVGRWHEALSQLSGSSALWNLDSIGDALVDLTAAHPSGIAQMFAGRPTRLSNLVREGSALAQARRRIRVVAARTEELAQKYGVAPTYVAMGVATWRTTLGAVPAVDGVAEPDNADATDDETAQSELDDGAGSTPALEEQPTRVVRAPVLLRPVRMDVHGSDAEINLELDPSVELNSVLVRDLAAHGVDVDAAAIADATMTPTGFSPEAALDAVAELGAVLEEFQLERRIVLGAFVHPGQSLAEDLQRLHDRLPGHPLVAALAGDDDARDAIASTQLPPAVRGDRDPKSERGVGDLDRGQLQVLDAARTGSHLLIDSPPGAEVPATAAAVIAQAVVAGDRVLYVPGTRRAAQGLLDRFRALGLESLLLDLCGDTGWRRTAVRRVIEGLDPQDPDADEAAITENRAALTTARQRLGGFVSALHRVRDPWQVSAYEALQALAELTSARPGPRTQVRLDGDVLHLDGEGRAGAREELARAAALGAFRLRAADTPWFGADLTSAEHALSTLADVRALADLMPVVAEQADSTAAQTGLDPATSFTVWGEQLELLEGVRSALEVFSSQVFERSAKDMAAATASRAWRQERRIDLTLAERRRLNRQARDLVRPGAHVEDLHAMLLTVERLREQWRQQCSGGAWPHVPEGLREKVSTYRRAKGLIDDLASVLAPTLGGQDVRELGLTELQTRLERLGADDDSVRQMPERAAALSVLTSMGLSALVTDLTERRVPSSTVGAEFDLAWWSSVLEEMLSRDAAMSGLDTQALGGVTSELRSHESAHIESLTIPVRRALRRRVRSAIEADRPRAQDLYRAARSGLTDLKETISRFGPAAVEPRPVWLVPPMVVPTVFPADDQVDLLILDAVQHLPVEHAISAIARARQVIVIGDTHRGGTGLVQELSWLPTVSLSADRMDQDPEISAFLAAHGYAGLVQPVPAPPRTSPNRLDVVDGSGMPAPDSQVVESVQAEVDRVVDLVTEHALTRSEESLAVIALNTRHADRVREAVASTVAGSRALERFFDPSRPEAFTVVEVEAAAGLRRDAVIISLGYGKTPHGRVLHSFGKISGPDGAAYLIDALDAVRHRLTVVGCFSAQDLDPHRLKHDGAVMLRELLQFASDGAAPPEDADEDRTASPLLKDLTDRLRKRGLRVVPHYGRPSGVRIPLAVGHPSLPGELVLAVLTDDDAYVSEPSLRTRDRHWVQRLENRGWQVKMVFSTELFMDPQHVADQIAAQIQQVIAERTGGPAPKLPTPPPDEVLEDELVSTNATLSALRGEQIAGKLDAPEAAVRRPSGERGQRPAVAAGRPLGDYGDDELDALLLWIGSDGKARDAEQLRTALAAELGLKRRGKHINAVLGHAVDRSGLATTDPGEPEAGEPESSEPDAAAEPETGEPESSGPDAAAEPETGEPESSGPDAAAESEAPNASGAQDGEQVTDASGAVIGEQGFLNFDGDDLAPESQRRAPTGRRRSTEAKAWEDDPRAWGDAGEDDDERITSERPPHWD